MQRSDFGLVMSLALVMTGCSDSGPGQEQDTMSVARQDAASGASALDAAQQAGEAGAPPATTVMDARSAELDTAHADSGSSAPGSPDAAASIDAASAPPDAASGTDAGHEDAGNTDAAGPGAAACAGKAGAKRGKSTQTVDVKGAKRTFVHYAPKNLDPNRPVPLVIVPHGYTQSGEEMFQITKYPAIADREGFVAVFPDGAPLSVGPWDVGSGVCGNGSFVPGSGDDQGFIDAMIAFVAADQCIDREHIFVTGWSMGGYLSHHTGCLRDDIRAIGPHSGGTHDLKSCKGRPKPVIMFHFDPDGLIDYSCGTKARDGWIARNGCQRDQPDVKSVQGGRCEYYRGCPAGAQVAFCTFQIPANHRSDFLAGHAWSGGNPRAYSIAETESAAELGWQFFKTYAW